MMRTRARQSDDTIWAPLADVMSLAACVFLAIFVFALVAYHQADAARKAQEKKLLQVGEAVTGVIGAIKGAEDALVSAQRNSTAASNGQSLIVLGKDGQLRVSDSLLFEEGCADLNAKGKSLVRLVIAPAVSRAVALLKGKPYQRVLIAGHTDTSPIARGGCRNGQLLPGENIWTKGNCYAPCSNWELSTTRATNVLNEVLLASPGIDRNLIYAAGFGETELLYPDNGKDDRNRRVEIWVKTDVAQMLKNKQAAAAPGGATR